MAKKVELPVFGNTNLVLLERKRESWSSVCILIVKKIKEKVEKIRLK